jgi:DNA-binding NarL/FixJ family response regulator
VLVADDQALVRANRCFVLEQQPGITVVGEAGDGFYAAELALQRRPDVVLKDIQMPGVDGLKAAR